MSHGMVPVSRDRFTSVVSTGIRGIYTSLKTAAGIGSSGQDFIRDFFHLQ